MSEHLKKSIDLAAKISAKAEDTLEVLEREMVAMRWPGEYRGVMWQAVADLAAIKARQSWGKK